MTTGHLIPNLDLTFLSNVNLSHLNNTSRQFIADRKIKFLTSQLSIQFLIFLQIIQNHLLDKFVLISIGSPFTYLDRIIIQFFQSLARELNSLRNNFCIHIVFNSLRNLTISQNQQFINQQVLQVSHLHFIFLIQFRKNSLVCQSGLTLLDGFRE